MEHDNTCPICYEEFETTDVCTSKCGHKFHTSCVLNIKNNDCPLCRTPLTNKVKLIDNGYDNFDDGTGNINRIDVPLENLTLRPDGIYMFGNKMYGRKISNNFVIITDDGTIHKEKSNEIIAFLETGVSLNKDKILNFVNSIGCNMNSKGLVSFYDCDILKISKANDKYIYKNLTLNPDFLHIKDYIKDTIIEADKKANNLILFIGTKTMNELKESELLEINKLELTSNVAYQKVIDVLNKNLEVKNKF